MSTNPTYPWAQGVFQLKRMLSTAATLIAVGGLALAGAGSASAHSAMVDGTAQCRPDGTVSVTWTVTNDYQLPVQVTQTSSTGGGSVTGLPVTIDAARRRATTKATVRQEGISPAPRPPPWESTGPGRTGSRPTATRSVTLPQDCGPDDDAGDAGGPTVSQSSDATRPGSLTVPVTEGVGYFFNGEPIAAGKHAGPLSGTVTAMADQGFELTGTASWPVSIPPRTPAAQQVVTPVAPSVVQSSACDTTGLPHGAGHRGRRVLLQRRADRGGQPPRSARGTVTAKAAQGFELTGTASWDVQIAAVAACETGGGETGGGGDAPAAASHRRRSPPSRPPCPLRRSRPRCPPPATSELAFTGVSPQTWTYGVGGGLALLLLGGALSPHGCATAPLTRPSHACPLTTEH